MMVPIFYNTGNSGTTLHIFYEDGVGPLQPDPWKVNSLVHIIKCNCGSKSIRKTPLELQEIIQKDNIYIKKELATWKDYHRLCIDCLKSACSKGYEIFIPPLSLEEEIISDIIDRSFNNKRTKSPLISVIEEMFNI